MNYDQMINTMKNKLQRQEQAAQQTREHIAALEHLKTQNAALKTNDDKRK